MLITTLNNISDLEFLNTYANGIVVYTNDFSCVYNKAYSLDEIKEIYNNKKDLLMFIDISCMMENKDIAELSNFIDSIKDLDVYYYYIDLGVHQLLKDKNLENRGVFNPNTLITNSYDLNFYLRQNMLTCQISNEIPLVDQIKMSNSVNNNIWLKSFGYMQMFHSKRHLISLYEDHLNKKIERDNMNSYLREAKREDFYHIYEGNRGTLLFRHYVIDYLNELELIKPKYIFLDSIFINNDTYKEVVKTYSLYLNNKLSKSDALNIINSLNLKIENGFKFKDTVYKKEEANE